MSPVIYNDAASYAALLQTKGVKVAMLHHIENVNDSSKQKRSNQISDLSFLHSVENEALVEQLKRKLRYKKEQQSPPILDPELFISIPRTSCLSQDQIKQALDLIKALKKEHASFWYFNKDRKQVKIHALTVLIKESGNYDSVSELANHILKEYPQANKGAISNRTGDFLSKLSMLKTQTLQLI